jgi:hypothetical protein
MTHAWIVTTVHDPVKGSGVSLNRATVAGYEKDSNHDLLAHTEISLDFHARLC